MPHILLIPGLGGSGPEHWQTRWETLHRNCERVTLPDWNIPDRETWTQALDAAVRACARPPLLASHSLGCHLIAHWALRNPDAMVQGALLVAPPDLDDSHRVPAEATVFAPVPLGLLPFSSIVLASSNDPYCDVQRAQVFATAWGAEFHNLGAWGHINADSHLGDWDVGWDFVQDLLLDAENATETRA